MTTVVITKDVFDSSPAPDHPGWRNWNLKDETLFNGTVMGNLIARVDSDGQVRLRMFPERRHENLQGIVHGAVTLSLIDIALFAALHLAGAGDSGPSVTLELSTQFVGAGDPTIPMDAVTEIVRETGSLVFLRGKVLQDEEMVAGFSGIVKKMRQASVLS